MSRLSRGGLHALFLTLVGVSGVKAQFAQAMAPFIEKHCAGCHDEVEKKGNLDLTALKFSPGDPANLAAWVKIHDRAHGGEMPPKEKKRPDAAELDAFVRSVHDALVSAEQATTRREGRATARRLNREEYENAIRDLFAAPWLQVKNQLPEDGEAFRSNKVGRALDVSHVHVARYVGVVEGAIRQLLAAQFERPAANTKRYYARETFTRMALHVPQGRPDRSFFPLLGTQAQTEVRTGKAPMTVGDKDPVTRELEAVGWPSSDHEGFHTGWNTFRAPTTGRYRVRFSGYTVWVGPYGPNIDKPDRPPRWWIPNFDDISPGRRNEPIAVYSRGQGANYRVGGFDLTPDPAVVELEPVWLQAGASLMTDAVRLGRGKPTGHNNREESYFMLALAQRDGAPAVAFRWMEVEGPLDDERTTAGYRLLFGDRPLRKAERGGVTISVPAAGGGRGPDGGGARMTTDVQVEVTTSNPKQDAERLLRSFMARAFRRPVEEPEVQRYLGLIGSEMAAGRSFTEAMISGYTGVLCSPDFTFLDAKPGALDDYALATRLSLFLGNSVPDEPLRARATRGELRRPEVLRAETERLLNAPGSRRFVEAFLERWLDLKKMDDTEPSNLLYPDYFLDDALVEAAVAETRMYFAELLARNLPARNVVDSDFTFLNERLATHYGVPGVEGSALRRVTLPPKSPRGGFMTQASVLKVTANGTTTSPVLRGVWIAERIMGQAIHPPPAAVPAVEPDIRGAVTIRQQIEKHRADPLCASCHAKIDPPGLALESFDVMGGWRDRYRATADGRLPEIGFGKNGWGYAFHQGLPVDPSGELADGRAFADVRAFKRLLLGDEAQIARNLVRQLVVYATGAPVRFSDRAAIERILEQTRAGGFGVRDIVHAIIGSELFLNK